MTSRYTWLIGVLALVAIAYITLNTVQTDAPGSRGVPAGERLPPFAAPLLTSSLIGDAQVDPEKACRVRGPRVLNSCALAERGPVALVFMASRSERCKRQVDIAERVRRRVPEVQFAAVAIRGDRDDVRRTIRRRGWRLPVAWDRDGAVSNAYAVAICPTITFADRGGRVRSTSFSLLGPRELTRRVRRLR
jgi:hypothetical protein